MIVFVFGVFYFDFEVLNGIGNWFDGLSCLLNWVVWKFDCDWIWLTVFDVWFCLFCSFPFLVCWIMVVWNFLNERIEFIERLNFPMKLVWDGVCSRLTRLRGWWSYCAWLWFDLQIFLFLLVTPLMKQVNNAKTLSQNKKNQLSRVNEVTIWRN